jgi:hypothetical protein
MWAWVMPGVRCWLSLWVLFRDIMAFDYSTMITALTAEQRLHFYELFAHNLTVAIRGVWSDEKASDAEKVERIKRVNEIMHRVTSKVYVLRLSMHEWTEEDTWRMIEGYVAEDKVIEAEVIAAIKLSYGSVISS